MIFLPEKGHPISHQQHELLGQLKRNKMSFSSTEITLSLPAQAYSVS